PSSIDHRKQRFPSTNLEEDFVNIKWDAASVQSDSFCTSFRNAIYPARIIRWFRGLPRYLRILFISSIFLVLLLLSIGIVALIFLIVNSGEPNIDPSEMQSTTFLPFFPKGRISGLRQFLVPLPSSLVLTLTPSPTSANIFFAFDNNQTMTVIEKIPSGVTMRTVTVEGMEHDGCQNYFPLAFSYTVDSITSNMIPWCCSSNVTSFCYAFNVPFSVLGVLVYKIFEDNVLHFTVLEQVGNYCTMTNYRITEEQSEYLDHSEECYGRLVPVQAASSTYRFDRFDQSSNSSLTTAVLLNDNSLHVSDGSHYNVYSFTSSSIHIDQLLLSSQSDQTMVGAVTQKGASIARVKDSSLSLLQFVPYLPYPGNYHGSFFDVQCNLNLFHSIDGNQSLWISEYAFSWSQ
ncbi:hypothetical protein PFISCL1PPCAC_6284, partial [Pristionchus fissidentatus]